jgi:predicted transcriptional regulator
MTTFTSSLPEDILRKLAEKSRELATPKNKIIERALRIYIDQIEKAEYIKSYKKASEDQDLMMIAEEGMTDYLSRIEE